MAKITQKVLNNNSTKKNDTNQDEEKKKKQPRKTVPRDSPQRRSSIFRGVTRHRWTGRYEAHLWDKNCWNESQNKKGRQVYLGAYNDEEAAARAYDLAALKYWGQHSILNFQVSTYEKELKEMDKQSKEEYIGSLRRKSNGFSRGVSKYRGVARHHHNGRWEARIGRVFGNKYLYLGTYATQEEAAIAYDTAAVEYRGLNAVTNFDLSRYIKSLRPGNQNDTSSSFVAKEEATTMKPHATSNSVESTSSTLGLLLQSSKFKEILEKSSSFTDNQEASPESDLRQSSFPEDIQTVFDCLNSDNYTEGADNIFGDMNSFASHIFHN